MLKRLWSGEAVGNDGPTWPFDPISIDPPPVQPGGPPVIVAGRKAPAMRRAAALGDGWMPFLYSPAQYAASVEIRARACSLDRARPRRLRLDVVRVRECRRRRGRSAPQGRDVRRQCAGRRWHTIRSDDRSCRRGRHPGAGGHEAVCVRPTPAPGTSSSPCATRTPCGGPNASCATSCRRCAVPIHDIVDYGAANWPQRPAVVFEECTLTFAELARESTRLASGLRHDHGTGRPSRDPGPQHPRIRRVPVWRHPRRTGSRPC